MSVLDDVDEKLVIQILGGDEVGRVGKHAALQRDGSLQHYSGDHCGCDGGSRYEERRLVTCDELLNFGKGIGH